jgi:hypothetical protein
VDLSKHLSMSTQVCSLRSDAQPEDRQLAGKALAAARRSERPLAASHVPVVPVSELLASAAATEMGGMVQQTTGVAAEELQKRARTVAELWRARVPLVDLNVLLGMSDASLLSAHVRLASDMHRSTLRSTKATHARRKSATNPALVCSSSPATPVVCWSIPPVPVAATLANSSDTGTTGTCEAASGRSERCASVSTFPASCLSSGWASPPLMAVGQGLGGMGEVSRQLPPWKLRGTLACAACHTS